LRERAGDIPDLVQALLSRASRGGAGPIGITDEAMRWLVRHDWPGNVRELANVVERAVALTDHDTIVLEDVRDLPSRVPADPTGDLLASAAERQLPLAEVERGYNRRVLDTCDGNVSRAARILGIDRRTLYRKLE
jgi:DNA-binding NtrC family response regulator